MARGKITHTNIISLSTTYNHIELHHFNSVHSASESGSRMRASVEHHSAHNCSSNQKCSRQSNKDQSPDRQKRVNKEDTLEDNKLSRKISDTKAKTQHYLLSSVAKVVVTSAEVVEDSGLVHPHDARIEIRRPAIQFHAVTYVLLDIVLVVIVSLCQLLVRKTIGLVNEGHPEHGVLIVKHGFRRKILWIVGILSNHLCNVGSVGLLSSLSIVVGRVGVATSPLQDKDKAVDLIPTR